MTLIGDSGCLYLSCCTLLEPRVIQTLNTSLRSLYFCMCNYNDPVFMSSASCVCNCCGQKLSHWAVWILYGTKVWRVSLFWVQLTPRESQIEKNKQTEVLFHIHTNFIVTCSSSHFPQMWTHTHTHTFLQQDTGSINYVRLDNYNGICERSF